ncbi:MAG: hypothetical protein KF855_03305 [Acidobacteria bacterium]|nr:hypothetical protein [Acidobacteriota bacterium]
MARKQRVHPATDRMKIYDPDEVPTLFDSVDYQKYKCLVGRAIDDLDTGKGVTVGAIHRHLGDKAIYKWTLDVLEGGGFNEYGACPTRYRRVESRQRPRMSYRDYHGGSQFLPVR